MRLLFCLLMCFSLSACLTTGKRGTESAPAVYDLVVAEAKNAPLLRSTATSIEVRAPLWLDTMGIDYRLLYVEAARLREYSQARWVGPPTQLIQQRLVQQLGLLAPGQGGARCLLRMDLLEFAQHFDTPTQSRAVLNARLQLLDKNRAVLGTRDVQIEKSVATADSQGAVKGLAAAVDQLANEIPVWMKSWAAEPKAALCGF